MQNVTVNEPVEQADVDNMVDNTVQAVEKPEEQLVAPVKKERVPLWRTPWPWLLLSAPLTGATVWLAAHPEIITNNLDKPVLLYSFPALAASALALWIAIQFFQSIITGCKTAWRAFSAAQKKDSSAQFFWIVIIVFMLVSVFASGNFFSMLEHNAIPLLGYATALFIDLVAVQAMRARLNAVRMRDKKGAGLYLFGVLLCAGASAFANVYTSLADFDQHVTGSLPPWMLYVAPWFGLVFPALIMLLSITADYTIDQISTKLDPEQYKEQEAKKTTLLKYQVEALRERVQFEKQIDQLTARLQAGKERRVFFLWYWFCFFFMPKQKVNNAVQIEELRGEMLQFAQYMNGQMQQMYGAIQQQIALVSSQHDTDSLLISQTIQQQITASQKETIAMMERRVNQSKDETISAMQYHLKGFKDEVLLEALNQADYIHNTDPLQPIYQEDNEQDYMIDNQQTMQPEKPVKHEEIPTSNPGDSLDIDEDTKRVLSDYPFFAAEYSRGVRSMTIEDIIKFTGHTPQLIRRREKSGVFKKTRREGFYSTISIITWLKSERLPARKETTNREETPMENSANHSQNTQGVIEENRPRITGKLYPEMLPENDVIQDELVTA
jgi:hypothetical protein